MPIQLGAEVRSWNFDPSVGKKPSLMWVYEYQIGFQGEKQGCNGKKPSWDALPTIINIPRDLNKLVCSEKWEHWQIRLFYLDFERLFTFTTISKPGTGYETLRLPFFSKTAKWPKIRTINSNLKSVSKTRPLSKTNSVLGCFMWEFPAGGGYIFPWI